MSILNNSLLLGADAGGAAGYQISRSLRFNSADSAYLSRTPASAGNGKTWTWAAWVKKARADTNIGLFNGRTLASNYTSIYFDTGNLLTIESKTSSVFKLFAYTTAVFRDPSAWYHIVVSIDTTQATSANGVRVYINGAQQPLMISPYTQNDDTFVNQNTEHRIGYAQRGPYYADALLADIHLIDGQALTPSSFGEFSATTGRWEPKAYTGTYGTNGFRLDFSDNSAATATTLGKDRAGSNNWTPNNLSVTAGAGNDSLVDTPTSYGTDTGTGGEVRGNYATLNPLDGNPSGLSNGNLDAASANAYPTIIPGSGQWYYEVNGTGYTWNGTKAGWTLRSGSYNFGQRPFAATATSGYLALCDTNLPAPTIARPSTVFDTKLYTSNASTLTVSGLGFSPDLAWLKSRGSAVAHALYDTVRGAGRALKSNSTDAEQYTTDGFVSFNSDGFTLGANTSSPQPDINFTNNVARVAWCWDAGASTVTNTAGSISSQVRANPSAGFSVVTYTGTGANATVGHGLGVAPQIVFVKCRSTGATNWRVYHSSLGATKWVELNSTSAAGTASTIWNNSAPTSTVFSLGTDPDANGNTRTLVAYCFAPVAGYSAMGSYTGNGSADGPFVYTGFRPMWVMVKNTSASANWILWDSARDINNVIDLRLRANTSESETSLTDAFSNVDFLSNGFKLRSSAGGDANSNGTTYIYAAFAESPFAYSRAR